jgi:hypothetical protein
LLANVISITEFCFFDHGQDDSLPTVDPSDVQSCSSTTASSTTATRKWVIYGDDAVAGLAASDYVTNFRGVQPVLHGSPRTTTEALQAALLPRGRPLSPDAQDAAGAHVYLLVGANDVLVNFPPRVALLPSGDPVMQAAAQVDSQKNCSPLCLSFFVVYIVI